MMEGFLLAVVVVSLAGVGLVALGVLHEVALLQERVTTFSRLVLKPAPPSFIDSRLPAAAAEVVKRARHELPDVLVLLFLRAGCSGCRALIRDATKLVKEGVLDKRAIVCVLAPGSEQSGLERDAAQVGSLVAVDAVNGVFHACEVVTTPSMLAVRPADMTVFDYSSSPDGQWLRERLNSARSAPPQVAEAAAR